MRLSLKTNCTIKLLIDHPQECNQSIGSMNQSHIDQTD